MAVVFTPSARTRGSVLRRREPVCSGIPTRPDERFLGQPAAARRGPAGVRDNTARFQGLGDRHAHAIFAEREVGFCFDFLFALKRVYFFFFMCFVPDTFTAL